MWYSAMPAAEAIPRGREAVRKILQLDPDSPEAREGLSRIAAAEWQWEAALGEIEKAVELSPNDASILHNYAFLLLGFGRAEDALAVMRRAQELDPLSPSINT